MRYNSILSNFCLGFICISAVRFNIHIYSCCDSCYILYIAVASSNSTFICSNPIIYSQNFLNQIVGPRPTSVPQALLDTKVRDQPLAPLIVDAIIKDGVDPDDQLIYNPLMWTNASNVKFSASTNWLEPPVHITINNVPDMFSQR